MAGMATRRRGRDKAQAAGGYAMLAAFGATLYLLGFGAFWVLVSVVGALISVGFAVAHKRGGGDLFEGQVIATTKTLRTPAKPRTYTSARQRAAKKRYDVAQGKIRAGTTRMVGRTGCSSRCQTSRSPKGWCRCPCGGANHGWAARGWLPW